MILLSLIAFALLVASTFLLLNLSPQILADKIVAYAAKRQKNISLSTKIKKAQKKRKQNPLITLIQDLQHILKITGKDAKFSMICFTSIALIIAGFIVTAALGNVFIAPIIAAGLGLAPFAYIKLMSQNFSKQINLNLETALSTITTSYMRGNNTIVRSIEENAPFLSSPVKEVFTDFLTQTKLINSSLPLALENMKKGIENSIFEEWLDAVIACQDDNTLKSTLPPIVDKLSDIRTVSAELSVILYDPLRAYFIMLASTLFSPFLLYFVNKHWWTTLIYTNAGKIFLSIMVAVCFVTAIVVLNSTKGIEYKR